MYHNEELHKAIIDVSRSCRLQNEDIFITDRLADGDAGFPIRVVEAHRVGNVDAKPKDSKRDVQRISKTPLACVHS